MDSGQLTGGNALPTRRQRLTIGLLTSRLDRGLHRGTWLGVAEAARARDIAAICFDGGILAAPGEAGWEGNVIYDLVSPGILDGVLVWSTCLEWAVRPSVTVESICRRLGPLPMISIGRAVQGIPSVVVDNYQGMHDTVLHLIRVHGFRRIAFLRGPTGNGEELLRYQAYVDALQESGIPLAAERVSLHTNWGRSDGVAVVRTLLDDRGLQPGRDLDAIVSVTDDMAYGVIEALGQRGIRVPEDVAVVGFNDDEEGRAIMPPLTTVRQPIDAMGERALRHLLALQAGRPVPEQTVLPLELIVRRSCGCLPPAVMAADSAQTAPLTDLTGPRAPRAASATAAQAASAGEAEILAGMLMALGPNGRPEDERRIEQLWEAFQAAMTGRGYIPDGWYIPDGLYHQGLYHQGQNQSSERGFGMALSEILHDVYASGGDVQAWHAVLSALRRHMLPYLHDAGTWLWAEDQWQQARVLIAETATQVRRYQRFEAAQRGRLLSEASQAMASARDLAELLDVLSRELPRLGVRACYLALYQDAARPTGEARLILAFDATGRLPLPEGGWPFPAPQLIPDRVLPGDTRRELVALPLYTRTRQLGFVLLDLNLAGLEMCETLRDQLSGAIEGVYLRQDLREALTQAEAASRLKSRFLATVSHELRTPLSLIAGTAELMLREQEPDGQALSPVYRRDLDSIHAAAQHLANLIGDVLDLASSQAGELRLVCRRVDLRAVLEEVSRLARPLARARGLAWHTEILAALPPVWADQARLRQVVLNLVVNAIKFTEQGSVTLRGQHLGDRVQVLVTDTGVGISLAEQAIIFDEFRQTERTKGRGYGGIGLGLAISRRLIELHGGEIGVRSSGEEGQGSTFYFSLPVLADTPEPLAGPTDRQATVLLLAERVDSEAAVQRYLAQRGFIVETLLVAPGGDWLDQVVANPPAAVVLDFEPATERGWELIKALREHPATQSIPVVFYTLAESADQGAVLTLDYASKPLEAGALARALEQQGIRLRDGAAAQAGQEDQAAAILIVDDDAAMLDLHARVVSSQVAGWRILKAHDGREALQVMQDETPVLVLLDLMMPELDGFGVLEAMRANGAARDVPVIILTAQVLTADDMQRLRQGVAAVLDKGVFSRGEVLAQIEAAVGRSKRLSGEAQRLVRQAMAYIHEHYAEELTREALAQRVGVSERYLTRCFSQETGLTPITYLTRYRIKQARALLDLGTLNVTEVALATGFSDSNYFGKVFRQVVGASPREYQRSTRAGKA